MAATHQRCACTLRGAQVVWSGVIQRRATWPIIGMPVLPPCNRNTLHVQPPSQPQGPIVGIYCANGGIPKTSQRNAPLPLSIYGGLGCVVTSKRWTTISDK